MTLDHDIRSYSDGDVDTNFSDTPTLNVIAAARYSRRDTLMGGAGATAAALLGTTVLAACGPDDLGTAGTTATANAGADITTSAGRPVTLRGSVANGGAGTFVQTAGPSVDLTRTDNGASFTAPGVAQPTVFGFRYAAAGTSDDITVTVNPAQLGFDPVPKNRQDVVTVPSGYTVTVMTRLGDPLASGVGAYRNDGTDTNFAQRIGDHGDALHFFGLSSAGVRDDNNSSRGLLAQNHENLNLQYLHPNGATTTGGTRPEAEAIKEIEAHGVSITEYRDAGNRQWQYVQNSTFNRRITPNTVMQLNGPAGGTDFFRTVYSPTGTMGRGTINNCANGYTDWGTLLTCEENWAGYFRRDNSGSGTDNARRSARELTALRRYGVTSSSGNYGWALVNSTNGIFRKWDARAIGASALDDYRNEPNTYGWVVEIDPYNPNSTPRKRTALGRAGHEGAWVGRLIAGQKVVVYMGDDSRREYLYKFVSNVNWDPADAAATDRLAIGDKYLDAGTLYAARFNADGSGTWLPLVFGQVPARPATGSDAAYTFASQADILVNTRLAADAVAATPMDRPEWTAVNPQTGEVYLTLTNNNAALRPLNGTDAANPRHYTDPKLRAGFTDQDPNAQYNQQYGNANGHIIRLREAGNSNAATGFTWDIYLFGADSAQASRANVNLSGLDGTNDFSSPDGLWFSRAQNAAGVGRPLAWIQTDDGAFTDITNNQMLAGLPGTVGDGGRQTITNLAQTGATAQQETIVGATASSATLKRFLVGPNEAEITGVDSTPDGRTLFVGIQHPGEDGEPNAPSSNWPQSQVGTRSGRPRSAVVAITRQDGGIVGL